MKLYESKNDNRSTSSSEYFKQRFGQSQPIKSTISDKQVILFAPSSIKSQIKCTSSEYEIFKPSQRINQLPQLQKNNTPSQQMNININYCPKKQQKQNPFLSSQYNQRFKNKQDKIDQYCHRSQQRNGKIEKHKSKINPSYKLASVKKLKSFETVSEASDSEMKQSLMLYRSNSFKDNLFVKKSCDSKFRKQQSNININNAKINTVVQQYYPEKNNQNHIQSQLLSKKYQNSCEKQLHIMLQHIYFTIDHQKSITSSFKYFVEQEKLWLSKRFDEMLKQLANTLNEVKIEFEKKIDENYKVLLHQMKTLKSMSQSLWKGRKFDHSQALNQNFVLKNHYNHFNQSIPLNLNQRNRSDSKSSHTYKKLSQTPGLNSPQSNYVLLNQLKKEDQKLQQYMNTKQFYFPQNKTTPGMVESIYSFSCQIASAMKQCENWLYDCQRFPQKSINNHKVFSWVNHFTANTRFGHNKEPSNIHVNISHQLHQVVQFLGSFRQNFRFKCSNLGDRL